MVLDILEGRIDFRNPASIYRLVENEMNVRCRPWMDELPIRPHYIHRLNDSRTYAAEGLDRAALI